MNGPPTDEPALHAIATATPGYALSRESWLARAARFGDPRASRALLERLAERTEIDARGCAAFDPALPDLFARPLSESRPGTAERLRRWSHAARELAARASREALAKARLEACSITHVATASCTGFEAPGIDLHLVETLGVPRACRRTNIGFMGCHAAVNALASARDAARSDPHARILVVCVEVSSVHFHGSARSDQMVADALFADGAAAFVVLGGIAEREARAARVEAGSASGDEGATAPPRLVATHSTLLPESAQEMRWEIGDHGFEMTLGARIPEILERSVGPWVRTTLAERHGLSPESVGAWAIHPGGPRVIDSVLASLGLPTGAGDTSRAVLRAHGNMSSATLGFILARLHAERRARPWIALAFGPGLVGEMLVVR